MKRFLLAAVLCLSVLLFSANSTAAAPLIQESESADILDALTVLTELLGAGIDAAAQQVASGNGPDQVVGGETAVPAPTEPPAATATQVPTATATQIPTATAAMPPTATNTPAPTATPLPTATEPPFRAAPADPEGVSGSTGIEVNDFYSSYKADVKNTGRHQVSFEEKARKNASRIDVDDNIEVLLYYTKASGGNLIDRIVFTGKYASAKEETAVRDMLQVIFTTLSGYVNVPLTDAEYAELYDILTRNGSAVCGDVMIYGTAEDGKLTVKIWYKGSGYVETFVSTYSQSAEDEFRDLIGDLKANGSIPNVNGSFGFHEEYENEWAQINWYQWSSFDTAQNFVISADLTWKSASSTPNYEHSGCGFVFRAQDTDNNLYAAVNMDGRVHFGGYYYGRQLSYGGQKYGPVSTKGSAQMVLVVNGDTATVYVDGSRIAQQKSIALTGSGSLAFSVWSGTNKDYGTRCTFQNVYYYTW